MVARKPPLEARIARLESLVEYLRTALADAGRAEIKELHRRAHAAELETARLSGYIERAQEEDNAITEVQTRRAHRRRIISAELPVRDRRSDVIARMQQERQSGISAHEAEDGDH